MLCYTSDKPRRKDKKHIRTFKEGYHFKHKHYAQEPGGSDIAWNTPHLTGRFRAKEWDRLCHRKSNWGAWFTNAQSFLTHWVNITL